MRSFVTAYNDVLKGGYVPESSIIKHIDQHAIIDQLLPESASFFYVMEIPSNKYRFIGRQQINISGYANDEFYEKGVELFLKLVHPEDIGIILDRIYPSMIREIAKLRLEDRKKVQIQYNYKFQRKTGEYLNLMEHVYILEVDDSGMAALLLGNVIMMDSSDQLPIKLSIKLINERGFAETVFNETYRSVRNQLEGVTARELEILQNLATGKTSQEIGELLYVSRHTVDTHRRNLLRKLGCKSVVDLTRIAFQNGLL